MSLSRLVLATACLAACATDDPADDLIELAKAGPVSPAAMADPGVYFTGGKFYAFVTAGGLHEASSSIAAGPWTTSTNVLDKTDLPAWIDAAKGTWAPDMIEDARGEYIVYFAAALDHGAGTPTGNDAPASNARCIGSARASSPIGPFVADPHPVVCLRGYGASDDMTADPGNRMHGQGVIDPAPAHVTIDGERRLYLVYKTQGPAPSTIRMVRLSDQDGSTVLGESHQLLRSTGNTFGDTIEGPSLVQHGSWFVLFVAHGAYDTCNYSTQWYRTQHIWSWSNTPHPLLTSGNTGLCGPGGADVTGSQIAGQERIFFHGWAKNGKPAAPGPGVTRVMYAAVLRFAADGFTPIVGERL